MAVDEQSNKPFTWLNDGVLMTQEFLNNAIKSVEEKNLQYPVYFHWTAYNIPVFIYHDTTVDELFTYLLWTRGLLSHN